MDRRLIAVFAVVAVSIGGAVAWRATRTAAPVNGSNTVPSIVVLLAAPLELDKATVVKAMADEFGRDAQVEGSMPDFIIRVGRRELVLTVRARTYSLDDYDGFAMVHQGWIAVDDESLLNFLERDSYSVIARVHAALWQESAAAVLHPQTKQWAMVTSATRDKLREPEVINALFRREPGEEPIPVDDKNPALVSAREEARNRWPEFVKAFRERKGQDFIVKAPITSGSVTEHIWITVLDVHGEVIGGRLANEPYDLAGLKLGSTVEVRVDEIDDWEYTIDGETRGYFTKAIVEGRK